MEAGDSSGSSGKPILQGNHHVKMEVQEVPGLGAQFSSRCGTLPQGWPTKVSRILFAAEGKKLMMGLKAPVDTTVVEGQRAFMRCCTGIGERERRHR